MDDLLLTVTALLEKYQIRRGSHSWRDYENGKFHLEELDLDSIQYHDACVIVADYLGIVLENVL
ncbi:MAG: hypothetical protein WC107_05805 [Patescibacteria group bacterium]